MAKRWTIPFVSKANKQCRIDIYDPGYTGSVTELSTNNADAPGVPAADPFYFEEDDDEDLLNVVRIKTGYINLIETVQDGLMDLYPTTLKSRYVEVFYDVDSNNNPIIVFRGYIQQQSFENDWAAVPREVSLPVISVLGIAESMEFDAEMGVSDKCIGYYMKQIMRMVEPNETTVTKYSYVTFPENSRNEFAGDFAASIRPLVTTTENPSFSKVRLGTSKPYTGIALNEFLEGICNAYGWILHDMPDRVLFTKFDNTREYAYYLVDYNSTADIETATGKKSQGAEGVIALETYMEPCADDSTITHIMPLRKITVKNQGEFKTSQNVEFNHMRATEYIYTVTIDDVKYALVFLNNADNNIKDIASGNLLTNPEVSNWRLTQNGVAVIDFKGKKSILVQNAQLWQGTGNLFTVYFYKRPLNDPDNYIDGNLKLEVECSWAESILGIGSHDSTYYVFQIEFDLYCGQTLVATKIMRFQDEDNYKQTVEFNGVTIPKTGAMWLTVKAITTDAFNHFMLSFDGIRLFYEEPVSMDYLVDNKDPIFIGDAGGFEDADVDMLMSVRTVNSHTINNSFAYPSTVFFTNYSYLRHPQTRLQLRMKTKPQQTFNQLQAYIDKIQFWQNNWRWRLIALSFHPWDDEWTLTMHRSSTIE